MRVFVVISEALAQNLILEEQEQAIPCCSSYWCTSFHLFDVSLLLNDWHWVVFFKKVFSVPFFVYHSSQASPKEHFSYKKNYVFFLSKYVFWIQKIQLFIFITCETDIIILGCRQLGWTTNVVVSRLFFGFIILFGKLLFERDNDIMK